MAGGKRRGRPQGEVQVGIGFDEKLKRLAELFREKGWTFSNGSGGALDADALLRLAGEQEADVQALREAWARYQQVQEPVMQRQGQRGAQFSAALSFARTAARRNRELMRLLDDLKIRPGGRHPVDEQPSTSVSA
jgi:hypothetical protein